MKSITRPLTTFLSSHTITRTKTMTSTHPTLTSILHNLNQNQHQAVTSSSSKLQIIAGPGTGKTKVLTSRVAFLLLQCQIPAENIIVTTFTKKAATEMTERLNSMLPGFNLDKLMIGTFHSICYKLIMKYGNKVGLNGYTIADERDKEFYVKEILQELTGEEVKMLKDENWLCSGNTSEKYHGINSNVVSSQISQLKSKGITSDVYSQQQGSSKALALLYTKYQNKLTSNKVLDFDDCLLKCHDLLSKHPVSFHHVLVDEFQDTNEIQLQLMYKFSNNVTIVGDPDQSIYAFRNAQVENFQKMINYYQNSVETIILNHNYRSSSDILTFSESIMKQQEKRQSKNLISQHEHTFGSPIYAELTTDIAEAKWIACNISTLLSLPNTPIHPKDIAILVRSAFQTRVIESELNQSKIPYHMIKGRAFWDRKEVRITMDYLRIVANENDRVAMLRSLNYPKRGIGEKTLGKIDEFLKQDQSNVCEKLQLALDKVKLSNNVNSNITKYITFVNSAKAKLSTVGNDTSKLIELFHYITEQSGLATILEQTELENINEIKKVLSQFTPSSDPRNILGQFIDTMGLNESIDHPDKSAHPKYKGRVSISTIHGAKGLEWPIVFVPGLSEGSLPSKLSLRGDNPESIDEERRCLYVAVTRAKLLLFVSRYSEIKGYANYERESNEMERNEQSRFIRFIKQRKVGFTKKQIDELYGILGMKCPKFNFKEFNQGYIDKTNEIIGSITFEESNSGFTKAGYLLDATVLRPMNKSGRINKQEKPSKISEYFKEKMSDPFKLEVQIHRPSKAPTYIPSRTVKSLGGRRLGIRAPSYIPDRSK